MTINFHEPTESAIITYLHSKNLETKESNGQIITNKCPFCGDEKINWTHFYINNQGLYFCHRCQSKGNLIDLAKYYGDYTDKPKKRQWYNLDTPIKTPIELEKKEVTDKKTELSTEQKKKFAECSEIFHKKLFDNTDKTAKKILDYLVKTRKLKIDALKLFKIGWNGKQISIPMSENKEIVNVKFRANPFIESKAKMINSTGAKMVLFNGDALKNQTKCIIVEGEIDALTLIQEGLESVVSITLGAATFKQEWVEKLSHIKAIYLCYDSDTAGQKGMEEAVKKLGAGRCYKIFLLDGIKDINDFFVKNNKTIDDFINLQNKAEKVKIESEHISHIKEVVEQTKNELLNPVSRGLKTGFDDLDKILRGLRPGNLIVVTGDSSVGKCHGKGTKILMYDGTIKKVENIKKEDKLMGIDSKPRIVQKLARGKELMYKITPDRGAEHFIVNKNHILYLRKNTKKYPHYPKYLEITVEKYLKLAKKRKHVYKLCRTEVKFKEKKLNLDPYFLGLWLGDGTCIYPCITTADKEIVIYLKKYAKKLNLQLKKRSYENNKADYYCLTREKKFQSINKCLGGKYIYKGKAKIGGYGNIESMKSKLKKLNLLDNKHIPFIYKCNSEKVRLAVLAGLIDSDGNKENVGYSFSNKNKQLCEDVIFIARSLGFFASTLKKRYTTCKGKNFKSYRIYISGDIEKIPIKIKRKIADKRKSNRNWLTTSFKVKKLKIDNYYGFTLNKDSLYLLDSFTINHNSFLCQNIINKIASGVNKINTMLFSLEETPEDIVERFLMIKGKVSIPENGISKYSLGETQEEKKEREHTLKKIDATCQELSDMSLYLYNSDDNINTNLLGNVVVKAVRDYQCELAVIDHLHYFATGNRAYRTAEIGDIVRYVKLLARQLKIPIILVCHLRKLNDKDNDIFKPPTLDDCKDSSSIKQDADKVLIMHRIRNLVTRNLHSETVLNIDKNRQGRCGQVHFKIDTDTCLFTPMNDQEWELYQQTVEALKLENKRNQKQGYTQATPIQDDTNLDNAKNSSIEPASQDVINLEN